MNPKKQKEKDRRRARKLADEAWREVDTGNLDLAEKLIRRAAAAQEDNPVLWNDQGLILAMRGNDFEAVQAFRAAISIAPTYADAYNHLANLRARQGAVKEAAVLQAEAVRYDPANAVFAVRLRAYQALAGQSSAAAIAPIIEPSIPNDDAATFGFAERLASLDWHSLGDRLTRQGLVTIATILQEDECSLLRNMFDDSSRFAKAVVMNQPDFGNGEYRYFSSPIPPIVDEIRQAFFPHVAQIANGWQEHLGETARFPLDWEQFRADCQAAGQTTPTPILLRYGPGGFNAPHRDVRGTLFFPIQLAVVLSERAAPDLLTGEQFQGGEFELCDSPIHDASRRITFPASLGDAILFCTRDRLVRVGNAYGLQPVKHGVRTITAGNRYVLGVPFHEYR